MFDFLSQEIDVKLMVRQIALLFSILYNTKFADIISSNRLRALPLASDRAQDQYRCIEEIMKKSLRLLRALARNNDLVQKRIFERIDDMLAITVVEAEVAIVLKEASATGTCKGKLVPVRADGYRQGQTGTCESRWVPARADGYLQGQTGTCEGRLVPVRADGYL